MKSLAEMQAEVTEFCKAKGWADKPVSFGEAMAMLHSEVSEALEAWRQWGLHDATSEDASLADALRASLAGEDAALPKPEGVGSEFADVLVRLLDDCERFGIDLEAEYERKMAYNRTRSYRHGGKRL